MPLPHVYDYDSAKTFLAGGRKVWDRPLYWGNMRVQQRGQDIALNLPWYQGCDLVLYHPDGSMTIQAPTVSHPWMGTFGTIHSQGVRYKLNYLAGFSRLYQKNGKVRIVEKDPVITAPKIQGCRKCSSSGKVDEYCWGNSCYSGGNRLCEEHPDAKNWTNPYSHSLPCKHGKEGQHKIPKGMSCYSCNGSGNRDYGSQPLFTLWDGSPLKVKDGKLVKREPTQLEKRMAAYVRPQD